MLSPALSDFFREANGIQLRTLPFHQGCRGVVLRQEKDEFKAGLVSIQTSGPVIAKY